MHSNQKNSLVQAKNKSSTIRVYKKSQPFQIGFFQSYEID